MKLRNNDQGSILLSTFHLLFFMSFLILSLTSVIRNQVMQLQQISQAYEAKALIEVSELLLRERILWEEVETGMVYFKQGSVEITKESDAEYVLVAKLSNGYTSRLTVEIRLAPESDEPERENILEEPLTDLTSDNLD